MVALRRGRGKGKELAAAEASGETTPMAHSHEEEPKGVEQVLRVMAQLLQQQTEREERAEAREAARFAKEMANGGGATTSATTTIGLTSWLDLYTRQRPPSFGEDTKPETAEEWLRRVEHLMRSLHCPEVEWVTLATFTFTNTARTWWESFKLIQRVEEDTISWPEFRTAFLAEYFPRFAQDERRREFMFLRQGGGSVSEYVNRFQQLERYYPELCKDERERVHKFVEGLMPAIRSRIYNYIPATMQETIETATRIEKDHLRRPNAPPASKEQKRGPPPSQEVAPSQGEGGYGKSNRNKNRKRDRRPPYPAPATSVSSGRPPPTGQRQPGPTSKSGPPPASKKTIPACRQCNKAHLGECLAGTKVCFNCGKEGHYLRNCPQEVKTPGTQSSRAPGRVYALEATTAPKSDAVIGAEPSN